MKKHNILCKKIKQFFVLFLLLNVSLFSQAQSDDTAMKEKELPVVKIERNFSLKYQQKLNLLRKTYPLALHAKKMLEEYDKELEDIEKKRKQKKFVKNAHDELKEEFLYNIKDLYTEQGTMLMKLIHRETGMTTEDILKKYQSNTQVAVYTALAKAWGNDLDLKYDPDDEDWITEIVINDILTGKVPFDFTVKKMDKTTYKAGMVQYKKDYKKYKKEKKATKKAEKKVAKKKL